MENVPESWQIKACLPVFADSIQNLSKPTFWVGTSLLGIDLAVVVVTSSSSSSSSRISTTSGWAGFLNVEGDEFELEGFATALTDTLEEEAGLLGTGFIFVHHLRGFLYQQ